MNDWIASIGVLFILGFVIVITKLNSKHLCAETSRKIIHITMGLTSLSFPFIFQSRISVLILGTIALSALLLLRSVKKLRNGIGTALLGVKRKSYGELYFAVSIVIVFWLHNSIAEYLIPMLVLTFADSVAALVGTNYGRGQLAYEGEDNKSSEGSIMFFVVAFICTLVPLQLMTDVGRAEVLVISFLIGLLAAMIEAVSTKGSDNFLLPLLTYSFVHYNIGKTLPSLVNNIAVMILFLAIILFVYKIVKISKLSVAYSMLVGYVIMVQGGAIWLVPPISLLLTFGILPMMNSDEKQLTLTYKVIECNTIVGVILLWFATILPQYQHILYLAYSLSFACHLLINTYNRFINFLTKSRRNAIIAGIAKSVVFILLPTYAIMREAANLGIFVVYLTTLLISIPPAIWLSENLNYKEVSIHTVRANEILVGGLTLFAIGGFLCFI